MVLYRDQTFSKKEAASSKRLTKKAAYVSTAVLIKRIRKYIEMAKNNSSMFVLL